MAPTFLTSPRNLAPITSRIRFEAIDNLRIQWDLAYDTIAGELAADNIFAGYSFGRTTLGLGHALLNAVADQVTPGATPSAPATFSTLKSQQISLSSNSASQAAAVSTSPSTAATTSCSTWCSTRACRRSTTGTAAA